MKDTGIKKYLYKKTDIAAFLSIGIVYALNLVYYGFRGRELLNSDASADLAFARLLNEKGGILSAEWFSSTEIKVISKFPVYKIALIIFPNDAHMARMFNLVVLLLLLAVSFAWLLYMINRLRAGLWITAAVIAPVGAWYAFDVIYNHFYIDTIIVAICVLALSINVAGEGLGKKEIIFAGLSCILAFLVSLSVRLIMLIFLPVFGGAFIIFMINRCLGKEEKQAWIFMGFSGLMLMVSGAGYVFSQKVLLHKYGFRDFSAVRWEAFSLTELIDTVGDLMGLFGWRKGVDVMSVEGIGNLLSLLVFVVFIMSLTVVFAGYRNNTFRDNLICAVILCMFLIQLVFFSYIKVYNESYWIPFLPFMYIPIVIMYGKIKDKLVGVLAYSWFYFWMAACVFSTLKEPVPEIAMSAGKQNIMAAAEYIRSQGYTQGYARFWNAKVITELTDFETEMWAVEDFHELNAFEWLQETSHSERSPEGKVFFLVRTTEPECDEFDNDGYINYKVYSDEDYIIYEFPDVNEYLSSQSVGRS